MLKSLLILIESNFIIAASAAYEGVAQSVEHLTFNQVVGSSSLPTLTNLPL